MKRSQGKGLGIDKTAEYYLYEFDSVAEYSDYALKNHAANGTANATDGGGEFWATKSLAEACGLAKMGWEAARPTVDGYLEPLREKLAEVLDVHHERAYDLVGADIDMDRYMAGEMEYMFENVPVEERHEGKVFTILVDVSMTASNTAQEIMQRGAGLVALVEAFNMLGYSLEVWAEVTLRGGGYDNFLSQLVKVANAGEELDINTLMFPLGHGDFQRRVGFGVMEGLPEGPRFGGRKGGGYGQPRNGLHFQERVHANTCLDLGDSFKRNNPLFSKDPIAWILQQLETAGVWKHEVDEWA